MLSLAPRPRMFLWPAATDMRKGFDALAGVVRDNMASDPMTGDVFVFVNRSRTHIKLLFFDGDGYVLVAKRLERGTFAVPENGANGYELRRDQLMLMLEGIDQSSTRRRLRYSRK